MHLVPRSSPGASFLFLLTTLVASPLAGQLTDSGTLLLRAGDREAGAERFSVTTTETGIRLNTRAAYGGRRPAPELTANLDRSAGEDFAFQLDSRGSQTFAVQKRNRLTIRRVARGTDQATELPGGPDVIILADSLFAPYLQTVPLATETGRSLTAVVLPDARRVSFTAQRTTVADRSRIRLTGGIKGEIDLGTNGEVLRISVPATGLEAVRKRD